MRKKDGTRNTNSDACKSKEITSYPCLCRVKRTVRSRRGLASCLARLSLDPSVRSASSLPSKEEEEEEEEMGEEEEEEEEKQSSLCSFVCLGSLARIPVTGSVVDACIQR